MKTTNYINTFIAVAEDCPAKKAEIPPEKPDKQTAANIQFGMISNHPYKYTSDDVIFRVFASKNDIRPNDKAAWEEFFSRGQACMRSSPLTKRYGWGVHSNAQGKIALYAVGSEEYRKLMNDASVKVVRAMRSKRA